MADSVQLIGKGPSAAEAERHRRRGEAVAVLNDAMKLVSGPVNFAFACDVEMLEASRQHWDRVTTFIIPDALHRNSRRSDARPPLDFPMERTVVFPYHQHPGKLWDFLESVRLRRVVLKITATCAMSWLAYQGFRRIRMIGFDGGTAVYAPGVLPGTRGGIDYNRFVDLQLLLQAVLEVEFGLEVTWLSPQSSRLRRHLRECRRKTSALFGTDTRSSTCSSESS